MLYRHCIASYYIKKAIEKAGSLETEKVREALSTLDLELSTWPGIAFDEKGQNTRTAYPVIQVQNGKYVCVYPEDQRENAPIYPTPEWKNR